MTPASLKLPVIAMAVALSSLLPLNLDASPTRKRVKIHKDYHEEPLPYGARQKVEFLLRKQLLKNTRRSAFKIEQTKKDLDRTHNFHLMNPDHQRVWHISWKSTSDVIGLDATNDYHHRFGKALVLENKKKEFDVYFFAAAIDRQSEFPLLRDARNPGAHAQEISYPGELAKGASRYQSVIFASPPGIDKSNIACILESDFYLGSNPFGANHASEYGEVLGYNPSLTKTEVYFKPKNYQLYTPEKCNGLKTKLCGTFPIDLLSNRTLNILVTVFSLPKRFTKVMKIPQKLREQQRLIQAKYHARTDAEDESFTEPPNVSKRKAPTLYPQWIAAVEQDATETGTPLPAWLTNSTDNSQIGTSYDEWLSYVQLDPTPSK